MRQEYPPEKDTKRFAPAPLRRRLHEFYFGGSLFVVLRAANRTAPDVSFRTPPRVATTCRETVSFLLANISSVIVPTLPNSNYHKRQKAIAKILASE